MASGGAIIEAARSHKKSQDSSRIFFETSEEDIEFKNGNLTVAGTDKSVSLLDLSSELKTNFTKPDGMPDTLDVKLDHGGVPQHFQMVAISAKLRSIRIPAQ